MLKHQLIYRPDKMQPEFNPEEVHDDVDTTETRNIVWDFLSVLLFIFLCLIGVAYYHLFVPPTQFSEPVTLSVERGMSVTEIADQAEQLQLVQSDEALYLVLTAFFDPTSIHAGQYIFTKPGSTFEIATKIASQEVDDKQVTITLPEGITVEQMASMASALLPDFDSAQYVADSLKNEGYMFPDTYYVPESFTADQLERLQSQTFIEKVAPLEAAVSTSTLEKYDPIILASIIEREANDETSMKMVSGILRNRLDLGMALQADATLEYVLETPINELPPGEFARLLDEVDSPYNTYKYPGLPPTAIGNPGLMAIDAALNPTTSEYLYYITGTDGNFYYAETLQQHNRNVDLYLR